MKKRLIAIFAALALLVVPVIALSGTAMATGFRSGDNTVVKQSETVDHSLFIAGNNVEIAGTVNGDVFCAGQNITITGTVRGDVLCAGQTVRVGGMVEGDIRLAGQVVTVSGEVAGNATIAGQSVVAEDGSRAQDMTAMGNSVTLNGEVGRDSYLAGQSATLNGVVGRNVEATGETLVLASDSETGGNVTYYSNRDAQREDGAEVAGELTRKDPPKDGGYSKDDMGWSAGGLIFMFFMMLVTALAIAALFPRALQNITTNGTQKPGMSLLLGAAALFLTPVLIIGLMITGVGILLALLLLLAYMLVLAASGPVFGYYIGRLLLQNTSSNPLLYMLLGASIVTLVYFIPILGGLVMFAAALLGTGMIVRELARHSARPVYTVATESPKPAKTTRTKK